MAQTPGFVAPGATPQAISFDLGGAAAGGPSVDVAGNVYFTLTQLGPKTGTIQKWTWVDGKVTKVRDVDGAAIGTMMDTKGRLLVGEWRAARVTADDMKGHITVLVDAIDGRKLLDPNAIVVDRKGAIYFTESAGTSEFGGIDYVSPDGKTVRQAAKLQGARKLIISPDGKTLIASGAGTKLWKFTVSSDGALMDQTEFCTQQCANPVGFDEHSNVYMAGDKLYIYSLKAEQLAAIDLPTRFSNGTFAGKDRKTLFLTGHDGVYTLQMAVKGAPTALDLVRGR
jgi:gluconolactonase